MGGGALLPRPVAKEAEEGMKESFRPVALLPAGEAGFVLITHSWWNERGVVTTMQHQQSFKERF